MSPEQVKGRPADGRSDIFSFGAILYEMLSGGRAFHRESAAETMSAILREEPPDLSATNRSIQPGLERIVRHCLEKNPEERFFSARDVAFDLEALSEQSGRGGRCGFRSDRGRRRAGRPKEAPPGHSSSRTVAATALLVRTRGPSSRSGRLGIGRLRSSASSRSGAARSSRRGSRPDVTDRRVFGGVGLEKPMEIFVGRPESPESRPFGLVGAEILAISKSGRHEPSPSTPPHDGSLPSKPVPWPQLSVAGGRRPPSAARS
jgi:serine/threonine protein kinase